MSSLARFLDKIAPEPNCGCWLWTAGMDRHGYGKFTMAGQRTHIPAHRASWLLHNGEVPSGLFVLHRCDVRSCVNPDHLFLGTNDDNMADMVAKGRSPRSRGEKNPRAKLTEAQALALLRDRRPVREVAAAFGVSRSTVGMIRCGRNWPQLQEGRS